MPYNDMVENFKAVMMSETLNHRAQPGAGQVPAYIAAVNKQRDHYIAVKIDAGDSGSSLAINDMADRAIARAEADGCVRAYDAAEAE